jgi:hypothetical protein
MPEAYDTITPFAYRSDNRLFVMKRGEVPVTAP